jgi:hypothetical protein
VERRLQAGAFLDALPDSIFPAAQGGQAQLSGAPLWATMLALPRPVVNEFGVFQQLQGLQYRTLEFRAQDDRPTKQPPFDLLASESAATRPLPAECRHEFCGEVGARGIVCPID